MAVPALYAELYPQFNLTIFVMSVKLPGKTSMPALLDAYRHRYRQNTENC